MNSKQIDMSVFVGQKFDFERALSKGAWLEIADEYNPDYDSRYECQTYQRPRLNHWHHNDGTMRLPDGLVIDVVYCDRKQVVWEKLVTMGGQDIMSIVGNDKAIHSLSWHRIIAVKIIGTAATHQLEGLDVVRRDEE